MEAVIRGEGDANARSDDDLLSVNIKWLADRVDEAPGEIVRIHVVVVRDMQHCEFIPAKTRDEIALANATAKAIGHGKQKGIAGIMSQQIVHFLEAIQIKTKNSQRRLLKLNFCEKVLHSLSEEHSVGEARQRIMVRHIRDAQIPRAVAR